MTHPEDEVSAYVARDGLQPMQSPWRENLGALCGAAARQAVFGPGDPVTIGAPGDLSRDLALMEVALRDAATALSASEARERELRGALEKIANYGEGVQGIAMARSIARQALSSGEG